MLSLKIFPNVLELRGHGNFRGSFKMIWEEELFQSPNSEIALELCKVDCEEQPFH
jgi:hypothetical protein